MMINTMTTISAANQFRKYCTYVLSPRSIMYRPTANDVPSVITQKIAIEKNERGRAGCFRISNQKTHKPTEANEPRSDTRAIISNNFGKERSCLFKRSRSGILCSFLAFDIGTFLRCFYHCGQVVEGSMAI